MKDWSKNKFAQKYKKTLEARAKMREMAKKSKKHTFGEHFTSGKAAYGDTSRSDAASMRKKFK